MPMIVAAATGFGDKHDHHETEVMVTEKLRAAQEGAHAGALETAKMTWQNSSPAIRIPWRWRVT